MGKDSEFISRLEKLLNVSGNKALSEKTGVNEKSISSWRTGGAFPKTDFFTNEIRKTGVNLHWLLTGEGPMMLKDMPDGGGGSSGRYEKAGRLLEAAVNALKGV